MTVVPSLTNLWMLDEAAGQARADGVGSITLTEYDPDATGHQVQTATGKISAVCAKFGDGIEPFLRYNGSLPSLVNKDFFINFWVYPLSAPDGGYPYHGLFLLYGTVAGFGFNIGWNVAGAVFATGYGFSGGSGGPIHALDTSGLNAWTMCTVQCDHTNHVVAIWANGTAGETFDTSSVPTWPDNAYDYVWFGSWDTPVLGDTLDGRMNQVAFGSRAAGGSYILAQSDIDALYNGGNGTTIDTGGAAGQSIIGRWPGVPNLGRGGFRPGRTW